MLADRHAGRKKQAETRRMEFSGENFISQLALKLKHGVNSLSLNSSPDGSGFEGGASFEFLRYLSFRF